MKKLFITLTALMIQFSIMAETWTLKGSSYTIEERVATTSVGAGTTYRVVRAYNSSRSMIIFYSVTDLTNPNVAVRTAAGGSKLTSRAAVSTMANNITNNTTEKALIGVNGGFFSTTAPGGLTIIDGKTRKGYSGDAYSAITFDNNCTPSIGYLKQISCWCSNVNGREGWSDGAAINITSEKAASGGVEEQIIFYTPEYGSTSASNSGGYYVQLTPVNGATLTPGKNVQYKVASTPSSSNISIPSNGIVMYGKGSQNGEYVKNLTVGTTISVVMNISLKDNDGNLTSPVANQAVGGSLMILDNGKTITSYANTMGEININAPRTAVGYNANKTKLVLCVVDGRNSGWSDGCDGIILGDIMKALGCSDALNFDGGGSSQFWTKNTGLYNSASVNNWDNGVRSVADGLFIVELPTPVLTSSQSAISFSSNDNATVSKTFTVSGSALRGDITLALSGTNANQFSLSSANISKDAASGTITVTYKPTTEGSHSAQITISSTSASSISVKLTGTNTITPVEPEVPETPETPSTPNYTFDDQNIKLTEVWKKTTADGWFSLSAPVTRSIAYKGGNLYVLNARGATAPVINIVDAYTGAAKGTLSVDGVAGGAVILSNIYAFDGKIYASNRAAAPSTGAASETLKIYRWDSDTSAPTVIKEDGTHGSLALGGKMALSGNSSNGRIWFGQGSTVVYYDITNGTVGDAKTIALTKDGAAYNIGANAGETDFIVNSDGSFWADGKDKVPALFNASGVWQKDCASIANGNANSFRLVDFGTRKLAAIATYLNKSATTLAEGAFVLADVANGVDAATAIATYPEAGFGATRNTQFMTTLCVATDRNDGMTLDVWYCVDGQGIGFYSYNGKQEATTGVEDIFNDEIEVPVEYYNLQGIKVANPQGGIFIKVQGNKVSKEYIR